MESFKSKNTSSTARPQKDGKASLPRKILQKVPAAIMLFLSLFCLLYWLLCFLGAGGGISALMIWPAAAVFFGICFMFFAPLPPFARLNKMRSVRAVISTALILIFCLFAVIEGFVISGMNRDGEDGLDYIIILGAHVRGTEPSAALRWRIERAYEYLSENPETVAVLSGGQGVGEDISEAECMRRELTSKGIDGKRLLIEDKSTSTYENIQFSLEVINGGSISAGGNDTEAAVSDTASIGIITNNFHVWRATKIAHRAGIKNAVGISAPYRNLLVIHYMAREFFSILSNGLSGNM